MTRVFLCHQIPADRIEDREKFDAIVYGTSVHTTMDAAKDNVRKVTEEFQTTELEWRNDDQLGAWVATDESDETWVIREVEI